MECKYIKRCNLIILAAYVVVMIFVCTSCRKVDSIVEGDSHIEGLYDCTDKMDIAGWDIAGAMFMKDGNLLIYYSSQDRKQARIAIYDISDWNVLHEVYIYTEGYPQFRLSYRLDGGLVLADLKSGIYYFYDDKLHLEAESKVDCQNIENSAASNEDTGIYYVGDDGNTLLFLNVLNGMHQVLFELPPNLDSLHIEDITDDGKTIILTYFSNDTVSPGYVFVTKNKEPKYINDVSYCIAEAKGSYFISGYDFDSGITIFDTKKPRILLKYAFESSYETLSFAAFPKANLIVTWDGQNTIRAYDMDTGMMLNSVSVNTEEDNAGAAISERNPITIGNNAIACIPIYRETGLRIYLWDCLQKDVAYGDSETDFPLTSSAGDIEDIADQIKSETGINVIWGNEAASIFPEFKTVQVTDNSLLMSGIQEVKASLLKYPAGFFEKFRYGDIDGFSIYLCGSLIRQEQSEGESPSAAAMVYENTQSIVLDISEVSSIEGNLAHEIMHAVDAKIDYEIKANGFTGFDYDVWNELNPPDFAYLYSYTDTDGKTYERENITKYTPDDLFSTEYTDNIYFTDYYSCTYPTEDRARIFECLMTSEHELPWFFDSQHLMSKAKYMCFAIRQVFSDIMPETAYWERLVDLNDM